jgi:RNA-directed DNA polymerase
MRPEPPTIARPLCPSVSTLAELATLLICKPDILDRVIRDAPRLYTSFEIPKPNGSKRTIRPPKKVLRDLQRTILDTLQAGIRYPRWMTGGVPRRSIFDHAKPHVGQHMVATFDVHAFFPSTNAKLVRKVLAALGFRDAALDGALRLVIKDDELPQGGPTSLFLANLALEHADRRIDALCRKHALSYTRYVDDMAISGPEDLRGFKGPILSWVEECGYCVAPSKIRFMDRGKEQIVTKLRVNDALRPTKSFVSDVKESIWVCLRIGAYRAAVARGITVERLKNSLTGKVSHIFNADRKMGDKLRGMLYGIDWANRTCCE